MQSVYAKFLLVYLAFGLLLIECDSTGEGYMKIAVLLWAWFKCDCANHRLNVNGEERCRWAQVAPVGDKIGSPHPPLAKVSPG